VLEAHWGCAGTLSPDQRRGLVLRAGLFGRRPLSRAAVARRLDVSIQRVRTLERSGIARLRRPGCGRSGSAASGATPIPVAGTPAAVGASPSTDGGRSPEGADGRREASGVLGAQKSHTAPALLSGRSASGSAAALHALLAFLAALLALLIGAALAIRRSGVPPMLLVRRFRRSPRPLLFLDVDGVISLWPSDLPAQPPGRAHDIGAFRVYIADGSGELLRVLASRFELVWASGWEGEANRHFREVLALDKDLPALRFDDPARADWKIQRVSRAAGRRPAAWIDDSFGPAHRSWASSRRAPTKLVATASRTGLRRRHVDELIRWADELDRRSFESARSGGRS
jgi:hypothetical protein